MQARIIYCDQNEEVKERMRGIEKVRMEMTLIGILYNGLKLAGSSPLRVEEQIPQRKVNMLGRWNIEKEIIFRASNRRPVCLES